MQYEVELEVLIFLMSSASGGQASQIPLFNNVYYCNHFPLLILSLAELPGGGASNKNTKFLGALLGVGGWGKNRGRQRHVCPRAPQILAMPLVCATCVFSSLHPIALIAI